jgi:hypothetical protein
VVNTSESSIGSVNEVIDHPDRYYVALGDRYRIQGNYDLAWRAYLTALSYNNELGTVVALIKTILESSPQ